MAAMEEPKAVPAFATIATLGCAVFVMSAS